MLSSVLLYFLQIHRDSSSSLSKLILQSYHKQIDHVSLTGLTPVHMLLEMGLDKMRKDYINYLIGNLLFMPLNICITLFLLSDSKLYSNIKPHCICTNTNYALIFNCIFFFFFYLRWRTDNSKPPGKHIFFLTIFMTVTLKWLEYQTRVFWVWIFFHPQCYYLSTDVDLQEQVIRLRKLHHLLEIILTCSTFLGLPYDRLFLLTQ